VNVTTQDEQNSQPAAHFKMRQVAATLSSRLEKAEQTHPQPLSSKFYCHPNSPQ